MSGAARQATSTNGPPAVGPEVGRRRSTAPLVAAVRMYQQAREGRPSPCRFVPSCSTYAVEALEEHGAGRGSWLALRRLCRCHPWGGSGFDPVPERTSRGATSPDHEVD